MVVYGDITYDSRVQREAETLASAGHDVVLACLPGAGPSRWSPSGVQVLSLVPKRSTVLPGTSSPFLEHAAARHRPIVVGHISWVAGYVANLVAWGAQAASAIGRADVWHLHDLPTLLAVSDHLGDTQPIVYDSHEIFLETGRAARLPGLARRYIAFREGRLVRRAAAVITVNPGIARVLEQRYRPRCVVVVRNCPPRWTQPVPRSDRIRAATGIPHDGPILLFHGALVANRGIERLVEALRAPGLERLHLVCLGFGEMSGVLRARAADSELGGRLHVLDAVAPAELLEWVASADVGAVLQQPADLNYVLSTPNKLFETIAAGVPVLASDLPEIRRVVVDDPGGPLGILCDPRNDRAIEAALRTFTGAAPGSLQAFRARCRHAADQRWNWETEAQGLLNLYERIASRGNGDAD
jgi:glycosyltransferase involved in cell wall biosynthesis